MTLGNFRGPKTNFRGELNWHAAGLRLAECAKVAERTLSSLIDLGSARRMSGKILHVITCISVAVTTLSSVHSRAKAEDSFSREDFEKTVAAIRQRAHISLSEGEIYRAALEGILTKIEASLSTTPGKAKANRLLTPRHVTEMKNDLEGKITGIGAVIEFDKKSGQKYPVVKSVIPGGGASRAGLKAGDEVLRVGEKASKSFAHFRDLIYQIRGKAGSKVRLAVLRDTRIVRADVTRALVKFDPVVLSFPDENIAHLQVKFFNQKTPSAAREALAKVEKRGVRALVVDVRGCGGGAMDEGVQTLDLFSPAGQDLLQVAARKRETLKSSGPQKYRGKLVVLVNDETMSMCEALADSLRQNHKAIIVGQRTFGKATVETLFDIGNGFAAKFTVAQLQNPIGGSWQKVGVSPDIKIDVGDEAEGEDAILSAGMRFLREL